MRTAAHLVGQDPTGSSMERAEACPGSFAIEGLDHESVYATAGVALHRFLERATTDRVAALAEAPEEEREFFAAIPVHEIPVGLESEVPLGYRVEDGSALAYSDDEVPGHRAYPRDGRIHLTLDKVGVSETGRPVVYDFKRFEPKVAAAESLQLGLGALAAARVVGATSAEVAFIRTRFDGGLHWDRAFLDSDALAAMEERVARIVQRVRDERRRVMTGAQPQLGPAGEHCTYCAARFKDCPIVAEAAEEIEALAPPEHTTLAEWINNLPAARAGALVAKARLVAKIAKDVDEACKQRVRESGEPLPLGAGKELALVEWGQQIVSPVAAREIEQLKEALRLRSEIKTGRVLQVRAVRAQQKGEAA